ncbi:UDP-2,3-diacylglucosamine hydrolase [Thermaurantimonas aggregans]|uniref:UDP-2,3-diacylglucosamine hydrolase n=1 Tax=Thermaurantimonas aggregans TaxID=2173829 RepID=A0A401XNM5_9FLAO|nr:UDP-2,3-diacylglucosamine diphosphatase [Thermaurantimonas aggregans]MCX8148019.1 UDP-2,3-diacylglucosamine diphosphatase [Thermaurantimonas aggregans]GCD78617.1 UDP-2,3-diacylglucosamine hydrolase [Thermaurantimonas aggregans]
MERRELKLVVISDTHLGTYGCRAKELHRYLKSIKPEILILNGDIIDIWNFRKSYFPAAHLKVIKQIISLMSKGVKVYYLTGNHDELLRKFSEFTLGNFTLADKLVIDLDKGERAWIFHGDVFDASIQNAKWLAKLGGWGYDLLILINSMVNFVLEKMGREKYSLSKKIKNSVKKAVKYISDFENTAAELAIDNGMDYVICGHIHQPQFREVSTKKGKTIYLNSGDWVENLTALEYNSGEWKVYKFEEDLTNQEEVAEESEIDAPDIENLLLRIAAFQPYVK